MLDIKTTALFKVEQRIPLSNRIGSIGVDGPHIKKQTEKIVKATQAI